jgi:DinB superfamily
VSADADFDLAEGLALLERTPAAFRALLAGLPDPWTRADEGAETFSALDNLGHLVHGERTDWIPRARIILAQGSDRRFTPFDRFAHAHDGAARSLTTLLDEFATLRRENLATLRGWSLSSAELDLMGEHPALGPVSLRQLLATWVAHDLGHLAQVARVMAKRYRTAVGPWRAYLPVLDR